MKKTNRIAVIVLIMAGITGMTITIRHFTLPDSVSITTEAKVLVIESKILNGKIIGTFLGSPDGSIQNDVIKVGVKITICGYLLLEDLELKHSELAYYRERKTLPLTLEIIDDIDSNKIDIKLNGRSVGNTLITEDFVEKLIKRVREKQAQEQPTTQPPPTTVPTTQPE